jgi:hypothetical protein
MAVVLAVLLGELLSLMSWVEHKKNYLDVIEYNTYQALDDLIVEINLHILCQM